MILPKNRVAVKGNISDGADLPKRTVDFPSLTFLPLAMRDAPGAALMHKNIFSLMPLSGPSFPSPPLPPDPDVEISFTAPAPSPTHYLFQNGNWYNQQHPIPLESQSFEVNLHGPQCLSYKLLRKAAS
ncbi:hypothetical protein MKZ38_004657 [Zalerion maritima]|uniref:Uncharacterized protein n=1 Tax=Zalerion maritima TaxID=339359 RepID=A0AAD5RLX3_9PEZI|nr:hypothetical protein MKZ38_004657 [Zalerion maritima]